jgi:hypothetical protein
VVVGASLFCAACFGGHVEGAFEASGGPVVPWHLEPDRCMSGAHAGYVGADMYRDGPGEDTEVVVLTDGSGLRALVRVPGKDEMVVLTPGDCSRFEADVHGNGVRVNGIPAYAGSVRLDCQRPEVGHVTGEAKFVCY